MPKDPVAPGDLPSACRTWDARRRVWVPKARYADQPTARSAAGKKMRAYRCVATSVGEHFHVGHPSQGRR